MTDVATTPPALRWVALFLAACAVLGLFLGFRDQIRKNPPGWYTGAEQVAVPFVSAPDGSREAVPFDPSVPRPAQPSAPAPKKDAATAAATDDAAEPTVADDAPATDSLAPKVTPPPGAAQAQAQAPAPRPKPAPVAPRPAPPSDPVGDILEGQKQTETPAQVPY